VAGRSREGRTRSCPATTAMWPAVWHGGRPTGRRATTRRIDRCVMPQRQRRQKSLDKAAGHRQVADKQQAAGGCEAATGSCPNGGPVSCTRGVTACGAPGATLAEAGRRETYLPGQWCRASTMVILLRLVCGSRSGAAAPGVGSVILLTR